MVIVLIIGGGDQGERRRAAVEDAEYDIVDLVPDHGDVAHAARFGASAGAQAGVSEAVGAEAQQQSAATEIIAQVGAFQKPDRSGRRTAGRGGEWSCW